MSTPVLQTIGLTKRYGSLLAVDSLSLEVVEGEVFGLLGPNGAGKTTSIHMICGLLKPDSGKVLLHGKEIKNGDRRTLSLVGMCPQEIVLWERLTCLEQLQYIGQMYELPAREARRRAAGLLDELGLADRANKQAHTLSGGMQRRLNLALSLVHDPQIVVLDEPEAGLDPQSRVRVRDYIQSLARRKTVILTTHNMDEAERLADRVAIIDHGRLLVLDTPGELKRRVGEGDVMEVSVNGASASPEIIKNALTPLGCQVTMDSTQSLVTLRALNGINLLPAILQAFAQAGVQPGEVRLRQNTLEDVFIQLTGRRLRE